MLTQTELYKKLTAFLLNLNLTTSNNANSRKRDDRKAKIEQIIAYLNTMHAQIRKYSKNRKLIFIDCGAGNCYLSFLVYYFYTTIDKRHIQIHCIDDNKDLMEKNKERARKLGFHDMHFHSCDIAEFNTIDLADIVFSLHACDVATDKTLHLAVRAKARLIFSVTCCQHTIRKHFRSRPLRGLTRHRVFKDRLVYLVGDALRALLLEMRGYKTDIIEFVPSRYTDKNVLLRAQRCGVAADPSLELVYTMLKETFHVTPVLESYLSGQDSIKERKQVASTHIPVELFAPSEL